VNNSIFADRKLIWDNGRSHLFLLRNSIRHLAAMNSRRLTSNTGLPPLGQVPPIIITTGDGPLGQFALSLPGPGRHVLGSDLNRSASTPGASAFVR